MTYTTILYKLNGDKILFAGKPEKAIKLMEEGDRLEIKAICDMIAVCGSETSEINAIIYDECGYVSESVWDVLEKFNVSKWERGCNEPDLHEYDLSISEKAHLYREFESPRHPALGKGRKGKY